MCVVYPVIHVHAGVIKLKQFETMCELCTFIHAVHVVVAQLQSFHQLSSYNIAALQELSEKVFVF